MLNLSLPDDKVAFAASVADFLAKECPLDFVRAHDEAQTFPMELFTKMAELGWQAIPFAESDGGLEGDALDEAVLVEQLGRAMGPLASSYVISVMTCGKTIRDLGTAEQRRRWLSPVINGTGLLAFGLTEPNAGSDAVSVTTRAVADGDDWIINGQKVFCTGASIADRILLIARTGERKSALSMFVVDTDTPGLDIQKMPKLGLRPLPSCTLYFDDVRLSGDRLLGEVDAGWKHLMTSLNRERLAISAMCTGMAQAALDVVTRYVTEREQFGVEIFHFEAVKQLVGRMAIAVEGARALTYQAAWLEACGSSSAIASSMAKLAASDAAVNAARLGMQAVGGIGYTMEYPIQRFLRDALVHPIAGGSNEIQRNIIAQLSIDDTDGGW